MEIGVKYGIEIECIYDRDKLPMNKHGYHAKGVEGEQIPDWSITNDSSLKIDLGKPKNCSNPDIVELVSAPASGIEGEDGDSMMEYVDELIKYLSKNGKYELDDVICINPSCGAHIHFSTWKAKENYILFTSRYKELKNKTLDRIKKEFPECYDSIKKYYHRGDYSRAQDGEILDKTQRIEINYTGLKDNKGIEWRAFNLIGVKTWEQFRGIIKIGLEEIYNMLKDYYESGFKEFTSMTISNKELKESEEDIKLIFNGDEIND